MKNNNQEIERILKNVKATLAIEGLEASEEATEISRRYFKGELTSEEAIKLIKDKYLNN